MDKDDDSFWFWLWGFGAIILAIGFWYIILPIIAGGFLIYAIYTLFINPIFRKVLAALLTMVAVYFWFVTIPILIIFGIMYGLDAYKRRQQKKIVAEAKKARYTARLAANREKRRLAKLITGSKESAQAADQTHCP